MKNSKLRLIVPALVMGCLVAALSGPPLTARAQEYERQRRQMIEAIRRDVARTASGGDLSELNRTVLRAMGQVPRHRFVPRDLQGQAYENRPLPIGYGQTISQPYIVALMSDLLQVGPGDTVFEVGTGSGYQAAVLARMGVEVKTMEIIPELAQQARERLDALGYEKVAVYTGDGYYGLEDEAPFDGIVVTAAASHVPPPLIRQLRKGGRMVIPVGASFMVQDLLLITKQEHGGISSQNLLPVRFVPLTGEH